ncbi:MAG: NADPH-dependent 7-cyano-7-deazaguanine reductase QueF [Dethiobacter sp.]|nr:NADPH-dependent 7-cyano-7-deazaguanine reductase QueF [Dethiobacter sp.]
MDKYAERRWDTDSYETIDTGVLEAIPFEYPGTKTEVEYLFPEFTSVCPWSGLPDFGTLTIRYTPRDKLVELKSLKYYFHSFRHVGLLQEHVVNRIKDDLAELLAPEALTITAEFLPRGGITTRVAAHYSHG